MPIDPKKLAEWKALAAFVAKAERYGAVPEPGTYFAQAMEAVPALIAEAEEQAAALSAERSGREYEVNRLTMAREEAERERDEANRCNRVASLAEEHARVEVETLRSLLASIEWNGDDRHSTCPACDGVHPTLDLPVEANPAEIGHRPGCRLAAALRPPRSGA